MQPSAAGDVLLQASEGVILFRGTPRPERRPKHREYAAVFFAGSKGYASEYGEWIQKYDVGPRRILRSESPEAAALAGEFLGKRPSKIALEDLFFHPDPEWAAFVQAYGYDGTAVGENIAIFDPRGIRLLSSERGYMDWSTARYRRLP